MMTYTYDALNRQASVLFPDTTQGINYYYDDLQAQNGKGKLTAMTDPSGTTWYDYDKMGRLIMETKRINNLNYRTEYTYDRHENVGTITYPGGRVITYFYNELNKVTSVTETFLGETRMLASNITYLPFGDVESLTYGNNLQKDIGRDNRYRIDTITTGSIQDISYDYYDNGNIQYITDSLAPSKNKSYTYDLLNRLTIANGQWGAITYAYDDVGNRTYETTNSGNTTFTYNEETNRLASATGEKNLSFNYDNDGNTTAENTRQYIYNQNQRLIKAMEGSNVLGEYIYNGKGQRAQKWIASQNKCSIFHYDQSGLMIAETTSSGNIKAEYVYLNGQPLAKIEVDSVYYYHNDHLGTPMMMTDSAGAVVWQGEFTPFSESLSVSGSITNNLRFPGQYYDSETGLHQNYYRDYKPEVGRYVEPDPIGLRGGINPYIYTSNNPLKFVDPLGLFGWADFVWHYYFGGGTPIDMATVGLLSAFRNAGSVQMATTAFKYSAQIAAEAKAKSLCGNCEKGTKSSNFSINNSTITNVTNEPGLFAVGHSTFFRAANCSVTANCSSKYYFFYCSLNYSIRDWFRDPLGLGVEPGGTTYRINASWSEGCGGSGRL